MKESGSPPASARAALEQRIDRIADSAVVDVYQLVRPIQEND